MGRKLGTKLSQVQKDKMRMGRMAKKYSNKEKISETRPKIKKDIIFGWAIEGSIITPVFDSEKDIYKGKIYKTIEIASRNRKEE